MRYLILILLFFCAACGAAPLPTLAPTPTTPPTPTVVLTNTPAPTQTPRVRGEGVIRVVHAAPGTDAINVELSQFRIAGGLAFASVTPDETMAAGAYTLRITDATNTSLIPETELMLENGARITLLFTGTPDALTTSIYEETVSALAGNNAQVRVIHAVPRGADFVVSQNDTPITSTLSFGQASEAAVVEAGETTLNIGGGDQTLFTFPITLQARSSYQLFVVGRGDDVSSWTIVPVVTVQPGEALVRVINVVADLNTLEVRLNGDTSLGGFVEYGRAGERITVAAQMQQVYLYDALNSEAFAVLPTQFEADKTYSLIVMGSAADPRIYLYEEDLSPTPPDRARVVLFNASPETAQIQPGTLDGDPFGVVRYAAAPLVTELWNNRDYVIEWLLPSDRSVMPERGSELRFEAGNVYLYLFTARGSNPPIIIIDSTTIGEPTTEATNTAWVRAVNLLPNTTVNILANDEVLFSDIAANSAADYVLVNAEFPVLQLQIGSNILAETPAELRNGEEYTLLIFGESADLASMLLLTDEFLDSGDNASVRFINLSGQPFGLQFSLYTINATPTPDVDPTEEVGFQRFTLPVDLMFALREASAGETYTLIPAGLRDLYITDIDVSGLARIEAVDLQAGVRYDVIVTVSSQGLRTLVLPLPERE
jgi:hypothetical protein